MKTLSYTLILVLFALSSYAQPMLNYSNSGYLNYESFTIQGSDIQNTDTTGPSSVWNYSTIASLGAGPISTLPPAATPKDSIPLANVAQNAGMGIYAYYKSDAFGIELLGTLNGTDLAKYTDPEVIMVFPFGFGYSHTDTWSVNSNTTPVLTRNGTSTIEADGYGTIQLPNGNYSNVLRTKLTRTYADYSSGVAVTQYFSTNVTWNKPGVRYPLATYTETRIDSFPIVSSSHYQDPIVSPTAVNDIQSMDKFITYYPNPVQNIITIDNKQSGNYQIELTDLNGKMLLKRTIDGKTQIDLSGYANGNYLLHLKKGMQRIAGELITVKH